MAMKSVGNIAGLLVLFGAAFYGYSMWRQTTLIEELCASNPVGTEVSNLENLALGSGVQLMGPYEMEEKLDAQKFIFCAPLTMCDVSCTLEVENEVVTFSEYTSQ